MARYFKAPDRISPDRYMSYSVLGENLIDEGRGSEARLPWGTIEINRSHMVPNFSQGVEGGLVPSSSFRRANPAWETQPTELFTHYPAQITSAFTHSSLRPHMVTLASMIVHDNPGVVTASDLSKHSSRLSKKGVSMGLLQANPSNRTNKITNDYDFDDWGQSVKLDDVIPDEFGEMDYGMHRFNPKHEVSDLEVNQARHSMREMLRAAKGTPQRKPHMSTQFDTAPEHPTLPGVDW